jgi:uncharacterized protein (DUF302 family)
VMTIKQLNVERVSYISQKPFSKVLEALDAALGHPKMDEMWQKLFKGDTVADVEEIMGSCVGSSGLIEFLRFNHGDIVHKEKTGSKPRIVSLVVGNPSIMRRMAEHVPDAGSYAPVTILIDERSDGVHLTYDRMASFLATYENERALKVARELDAKVEGMLASIG